MAQNETQQHIRTLDIDKKIVANIDNGIIILDEELVIYHFNKWLQLHTHLSEVDILNKKLDEVFSSINTKTLKRKIKTALRLQTPTFYTANTSKYLIPIKINQIKYAKYKYMQQDISIIPFDEEKGLVALILTDQTIMANANALLEENIITIKELNAELIKERETIDQKVLVLKFDKKFQITEISQALLRLLNYEKDSLMGENFLFLERHHLSDELQMQLTNSTRELKVFDFGESTLNSHGKRVYFKSTLVPEYNAKGEHIGFILFRENITSAKELEKSQEKVLISARSAAMGEMISMIAHQWRQPLSLINTIMATLKIKHEIDSLDESSIEKAFSKIETTTRYLSDTIDDFRDYFKPNKKCAELNLLSFFENSIVFLKEEMHQRNIRYNIDIHQDLNIVTCKNELLQCIINIIKNSLDAFEDSNDASQQISIVAQSLESHIAIKIIDNAGGINPDVLQRVFEPYYSTKSKNGTGLGLYMSHSIITQHLKGNMSMSSNKNTTTTLIELPYQLIKEKK